MSNKNLEDLFCLENKIALVTGGAGYLGGAISHALAELGSKVIIASRNVEKCQIKAEEINQEYNRSDIASAHSLNINSNKSIKNIMDYINEKFDGLDILINNAYSGSSNSFETITEEEWLENIDTGLNGVFRMIKEALNLLKSSEGVILNIASMYGHIAPDPDLYKNNEYTNPPSYGAAKAGVIQLTKYLASFLSKYNVRVNAISPGPFPHEEVLEDEEFINQLSDKNTLKRVGKPYELKGAVALLCSDASSYINGENICVDGGWTVN